MEEVIYPVCISIKDGIGFATALPCDQDEKFVFLELSGLAANLHDSELPTSGSENLA